MYATNEKYYSALYEAPAVRSYVTGVIALDNEEIIFTDKDILNGSLSINNKCVNGSSFDYGAVYQGEMNITLMINADRYSLYGKNISLTAHYVIDGKAEKEKDREIQIPLGKWQISAPERSKKLLTIKALDAMSDFSKIIPAAFTGTAFEMLTEACTKCGVPLGMTQADVEALTNGCLSYYADTAHFDTYRDLLAYLGKCTCTFATINRAGALVLREYGKKPVRAIPEGRRNNTVVADYETYHKGVKMRFIAEENYWPYDRIAEGDGITLDLGDIPIVRGTPEEKQAVCDAIYNKLSGVIYTPVSFVQLVGDPTLELGDMIEVDGINSLIMSFTWQHHGGMKIQGLGDDAKYVALKSKYQVDIPKLNDTLSGIEEDVQENYDELTAAFKEATELINGTAGGYFTIMTDTVMVDGVEKEVPIGWRIMDTPSLNEHTKLWQMSMGGFAFSADGGRTFTNVSIDMEGNINANNMTGGTITGGKIIGAVIDVTGKLTATELDCTTATVEGLIVGENVTMGEDAVISWSNLPDGVASSSDIPSDAEITQITKDTISTSKIKAQQIESGTWGYDWSPYFIIDEDHIGLGNGLANININGGSRDIEISANGGVGIDTGAGYLTVNGSNVALEGSSPTFRTIYCTYLGASSDYLTMVHTNNVCIHTTTTTSADYCGFSSSGYLQKYSGSSKQHKHGIHALSDALKEKFRRLYDIEIKNWTYNDDYIDPSDELYQTETYGLIAEDVADVLPEAVVHDKDGNIDNYRDRQLINAMLFLLQEQKQEIELLKEKFASLEKGGAK